MIHPHPGRDDRIDALRGFALLGILLVNIQSFVWGGTSPAGYLQGDATALDRALFFLTAAFVNTKFMPLFAMLFGAGFALLLARLRSVTSAPHAVFRRRMQFLFAFGVLHGVLLYFGDITQMYALAGLVLLRYDGRGPVALRRAVVVWWIGAIALTALLTWGVAASLPDPVELADELEANFAVFTGEGYFAQLPTRVGLFVDIVIANLIGLPMAVALMLTGMLAQRAGWLADRAAPAWRAALAVGIVVGLPSALAYGVLLYREAEVNGLGAYSAAAALPGALGATLSFAYAALFFQRASTALVRWLSPAGRMPLTNYLLQSVAMGALLSGWGLALAPRLGYAQTTALGLAIFAAQLALSHWWLRRFGQGPLERAWRTWTYSRMPPAVPLRTGE
ncbi:MAG: DUF418 domain-containing protein [Betaproteobacteria bacterium]